MTVQNDESIELLVGLSEGPIAGLLTGDGRSIIANDTYLTDPVTLKNNFEGFEYKFFAGDPLSTSEKITPNFGGTVTPQSVNIAPMATPSWNGTTWAPTTHTITLNTQNCDFIELGLQINQLYTQPSKGGLEFNNAILKIEVKRSIDADFSPAFTWTTEEQLEDVSRVNGVYTISSVITSPTLYELRFPVTKGAWTHTVKVTILHPGGGYMGWIHDSGGTGPHYCNITWTSINAVIVPTNGYLQFPGTAAMQLLITKTDQLSSQPRISGIYKGRILSIPNNYNPTTRVYTGSWGGSFSNAYTDNPAWVLYDLITNTRYGLASTYPASGVGSASYAKGYSFIDKYQVYAASQWCDQLVSDGNGGTEPRFTFNAVIYEPSEALQLLNEVAGVFHGVLFDDENRGLSLSLDNNASATYLFIPENVDQAGFNYTYVPSETRYNEIEVQFRSTDTVGYKDDYVVVRNQGDIDLNGLRKTSIKAFGCTKQSEAIRRGNYRLAQSLNEITMVSFSTNRLAYDVEPYSVISVADPNMLQGLSGRVKSIAVDNRTITLRDALTFSTGITYTIKFVTSAGIVSRTFTVPANGLTTSIYLSSSITTLPDKASFSIEQTTGGIGKPKNYRVVKVSKDEGNLDKIVVTAIEIYSNKWVDGDTPTLQPTSTTNIGDPLNIPPATSVSFTTTYDVREKALWLTVVPTFDHSAYKYYSDRFEVWSRATEGLSVSQNSVTGKKKFKKRTLTYNNVVLSHPSGEHEFRIVPINTYGQAAPLGKIPTVVYTVLTEAQAQTIPTAPANLTATSTGLGVSLNWTIDASDEKEYATTFIIKEGNPTPTTTIATDVKGTSYTIPAVTKRSNRFWVYAVTAAGKQSNASVYADYNKVAPPAPTDIEIQQTGEGITLLFEKSTSNLVTRSLTHWRLAGGTWRSAKADNMINHNEVDILPNETYEMRVANIDHLSASLNDYVWSPTYSINTTHMDTVENEKIRLQNSISFNLVRCGAFVKDPSLYWTMGSTEVVQYPSAPQYDYVAGDNNVGRIKATYEYGSFIKSREKAYYTMSADIQNLSATSFQFRLRCYNSSNTLISTLLSPSVLAASMSFSEFMRASYSFETPSGTVNMKPAIVVAGTGSILADGIMLQAGMRATGFMPHISEVLSQQDLESMAKEDEVTPPTPSTTTFLATGNFRSIYLNWDAPASPADGVAWYNIYRSTSPESTSAIKVGSSQVNFYTDSSGVTGKLYYYWITAVSNTGNESAKTTYITGSMIGATSSDIQNAAIINAHIADAAIDDAKIGNLSASKILAGTITAESIGLGASGRVKLLAGSAPGLTITRPNNNLALKLGKFDGSYDDNYGLWLYDNSGQLVVSVDGLGLDVVGTKNIANNSVTNSSAVNSTVDYNLSTNYEPVLETYLTTSGGNVFILATAMVNPGNIGRILYWRILRGDYIIQDGTYYAGSGGIVGGLCSVSAVDVAVTGTHRYSLELTISSSAGAYVGLRTLFVQEVKK